MKLQFNLGYCPLLHDVYMKSKCYSQYGNLTLGKDKVPQSTRSYNNTIINVHSDFIQYDLCHYMYSMYSCSLQQKPIKTCGPHHKYLAEQLH